MNPQFLQSEILSLEKQIKTNQEQKELIFTLGIKYALYSQLLWQEAQRQLTLACQINPAYQVSQNNLQIINKFLQDTESLYKTLEGQNFQAE